MKTKITTKDADDITKLLMKKVRKDKGDNLPHYNPYLEPNKVQQADLLILPNDKGFKYLLVVVDIGSKLCDAEPLKNKDARSVKAAFIKLYSRKLLELPLRIEVDGGPEFKNEVSSYFHSKGVYLRKGLPDRHRQQAIVERYNQMISVELFKKMITKQLLSKKLNGQWVDNLKNVIQNINMKQTKIKTHNIPSIAPVVNVKSKAVNLLSIGDYVLTALDAPKETTGDKLHGTFRATDIRYDPNLKIIRSIVLKPGVPPLYLVSLAYNNTIIHAGYTKNQLLPLSPKEIKILKELNY